MEEYEIVKVVNNTVERKLREELEILKEREKGLDNLINIKIKFDNEEILYNFGLGYVEKNLEKKNKKNGR